MSEFYSAAYFSFLTFYFYVKPQPKASKWTTTQHIVLRKESMSEREEKKESERSKLKGRNGKRTEAHQMRGGCWWFVQRGSDGWFSEAVTVGNVG